LAEAIPLTFVPLLMEHAPLQQLRGGGCWAASPLAGGPGRCHSSLPQTAACQHARTTPTSSPQELFFSGRWRYSQMIVSEYGAQLLRTGSTKAAIFESGL